MVPVPLEVLLIPESPVDPEGPSVPVGLLGRRVPVRHPNPYLPVVPVDLVALAARLWGLLALQALLDRVDRTGQHILSLRVVQVALVAHTAPYLHNPLFSLVVPVFPQGLRARQVRADLVTLFVQWSRGHLLGQEAQWDLLRTDIHMTLKCYHIRYLPMNPFILERKLFSRSER